MRKWDNCDIHHTISHNSDESSKESLKYPFKKDGHLVPCVSIYLPHIGSHFIVTSYLLPSYHCPSSKLSPLPPSPRIVAFSLTRGSSLWTFYGLPSFFGNGHGGYSKIVAVSIGRRHQTDLSRLGFPRDSSRSVSDKDIYHE